MRYLAYDIETRSTLSLKQVGAHRYTCDPTTDVWCVSFCTVVDGVRGDIATWLPGDPVPDEITAAAADPETLIIAFNDAFERQVEQRILHPRYGWPIFPIERRRCARLLRWPKRCRRRSIRLPRHCSCGRARAWPDARR